MGNRSGTKVLWGLLAALLTGATGCSPNQPQSAVRENSHFDIRHVTHAYVEKEMLAAQITRRNYMQNSERSGDLTTQRVAAGYPHMTQVVTPHCVPREYIDIGTGNQGAWGYSIDFWFPSGLPITERAFDHKLDFTESKYVDGHGKIFMVDLEVHFPRRLWDENWFDLLHNDLSKAPVVHQLGPQFRIVPKAPILGAEKLFKTEIPLQGTDRYWIMPLDEQLRAKLIIGCQGTFFGRDNCRITTKSERQNVNLSFTIFASNLRFYDDVLRESDQLIDQFVAACKAQ